ncbi:MAG: hypothetical protein PUB03_05005 [bacterium]|jgi:hypothetical protein|nr:hypothetical protein [bacterium]
MNLKDTLIKYRDMLTKSQNTAATNKTSYSDGYMKVIKDNIDNVRLTEQQFEFLKNLYLTDGKIVGLHNTINRNLQTYFDTGLYNYDRTGKEDLSLSNTVMTSSLLSSLIPYHVKNTTLILAFNEELIKGEPGLYEGLKDGKFGIPSKYIVGAFQNGKVITNPNYDPNYKNKYAIEIDDAKSNFLDQRAKEENARICSTLFYAKKDSEDKKSTNIDKSYN